jgi:hypothetical protein
MGLQGWSLVNAFPMGDASSQKVYHFYFKKLFNKEDILKEQNGE